MDQLQKSLFQGLPEPTILWTSGAVKGIICNFPNGITVSELVSKFHQDFGMDLPLYGYSSPRHLLEAMPDIVKIDGEMVYDASKLAAGNRFEEYEERVNWTKSALKSILSQMPGGITIDELNIKFRREFFMPLPMLNYPNHRLMLESFNDILEIHDDKIYAIGQFGSTSNPEEIHLCVNWTKQALKFILSPLRNGLTFNELKAKFEEMYHMPMPLLRHRNYRLMLESFNDVFEINGDRIFAFDQFPSNVEAQLQDKGVTNVEYVTSAGELQLQGVSVTFIRSIIRDILTYMNRSTTLAELKEQFRCVVGFELPRFHFATHRQMLEAMQDLLVFDGDQIYLVGEIAASLPVAPIFK